MKKSFYEAIELRRSHYAINNEQIVPDDKLQEIIEHAVKHTPSAFNSQTSRVVLLLAKEHKKLWDITTDALRKIVPEEVFKNTEDKMKLFSAGYGTVLFFEENDTIEYLQNEFAEYKDNFPIWSLESSGMIQFNIWTSLRLEGYGASLQHYNELIEEEVKKEWDLPKGWRIRAQMPFGKPISAPSEKEFNDIKDRVFIFNK